jgi:DMSO/TMAO reductase YedYZ molybdopterin-dependent catalytic subunit
MEFARRVVFAVVLVFAAGGFAFAEPVVVLDGQVQKSGQLRESDLKALPATTESVSFMTGKGAETGSYTGVLLWTLLTNATIIEEPKTHLSHIVMVTGSDGYAVSFSIGELDPKFEGKQVILAYAKDGQPLGPDDGLRLIVPRDVHGGRAVKDVVHIEVR